MTEHLEAVSRGELRNLLINIPPRHMKSLAVSVFWPVWAWLTHPESRWLFSSYALSLSTRDSVKCRRLIESPWFQRRWGHVFQLTGDQNQKMRFENDKTGYRIATSVGGAATGEGGDVVCVDDPHSVEEKESDAIRESTLIWWDETMSTRLNDQKTGAKVIVMQRVHEKDLSGHVLEQGGYVHLRLPAEFEPQKRCTTSIGFVDPRQHEGELLWPEHVGPNEIEELKRRLGPSGFAGQFQQRPVPAGGLLFRLEWFDVIDAAPPCKQIVRAWDMAATEESTGRDPDWTVGAKIGEGFDGNFYILDVKRAKLGPADIERLIQNTAMSDGHSVAIRFEQEPGSAGKGLVSHYERNILRSFAMRSYPATGDKVTRANPFSSACERRVVKLVRGEWNNAFLDEMCLAKGSKIVTMRGDIPIEEVTTADFVATRAGWKRVVKSECTSKAATLWEIATTNGTRLCATENHPILVNGSGFKLVRQLKVGDDLLRFTGASDLSVIQTPGRNIFRRWLTVIISNCIGAFGCAKLGRFLAGIMSIIKMRTRKIIDFQTFNVFLRRITSQFIGSISGHQRHAMLPALSAGLITRAFSPEEATHALRSVQTVGSKRRGTRAFTTGYVRSAAVDSLVPMQRLRIAASNAPQKLFTKDAAFQRNRAANAVRTFDQRPALASFVPDVAVSSIRTLPGKHSVYNLEVDGCHEYIANGLVVHNCAFPKGGHDDQVDAAVNAYTELTQGIIAQVDSGFYVLSGSN